MKLSKGMRIAILLFPILFFFVMYGGLLLIGNIALAMARAGNENYSLLESLWQWETGLRPGVWFLSCLFSLGWILLLLRHRRFSWKKRFACCGGYLLWIFVIILFFVLPETYAAREKANARARCIGNLIQIRSALQQYEADYGVLPPDLRMLDRLGYLSADSILRCPNRSVEPEFTDYEYYGKDRSLKEKPFVLLEDRAHILLNDCRNILLWSDGRRGPKRIK